MPTLSLTDEQAVDLVKQLPLERHEELLRYMLQRWWSAWTELSSEAVAQARILTRQRALDWDTMTEEERETFIDDLMHEDR